MASIVDRPNKSVKDDLLELKKYTDGLIKFIESSATPITIGIQGEWGSGKTSLLNTIKEDLCDKDDSKHYAIWLNTWEYSLLSSPDETLIKIISGLVNQIATETNTENSENAKKIWGLLSKVAKGVADIAGGPISATVNLAVDTVDGKIYKPQDNSIKALREALQEVINKAVKNSDKKAFIFFIDDLDRLDPSVAVNILELIKNLFDLDDCIFVLAIDYGVVVKGLQSKFGVMTEENEWEFRAFFDKIIQLPFSMPISTYDVSNYLKTLLTKVGYFQEKDLSKDNLDKIVEIVGYSIGTNPRALVRLTNSVALIEMIRGKQTIEPDERVIEFALVCLQIAYPLIYGLIQKEPDFTDWGDEDTLEILKNKNIDVTDLKLLKDRPEFNEPWEQNLWKVCQINSFLKQKVFQVSNLLNFIKTHTPAPNDESIGDTLERLLKMSSFTSVSADSIVSDKKRKKYTRLSSKKKQKITNDMQSVINERVKNKHVNYFSNQSDFKIRLQGDKRNVWLPVKIDDVEFNLCVWTNHRNIKIFADSKVSNEKTIVWFKENMGNIYQKMKFDKFAKDGIGVVVLDEYLIINHTQAISEYENAIEDTFNKFLSKIAEY